MTIMWCPALTNGASSVVIGLEDIEGIRHGRPCIYKLYYNIYNAQTGSCIPFDSPDPPQGVAWHEDGQHLLTWTTRTHPDMPTSSLHALRHLEESRGQWGRHSVLPGLPIAPGYSRIVQLISVSSGRMVASLKLPASNLDLQPQMSPLGGHSALAREPCNTWVSNVCCSKEASCGIHTWMVGQLRKPTVL